MTATFEPIRRILFESLRFRRAGYAATRTLATRKHNRDLCPTASATAETILRSINRHLSMALDIQGLRDAGVDVVVRLQSEQSANDYPRFIALQVKSHDDLQREGRGGLISKLKAQYVDAQSHFGEGLLDYYVLLAVDPKEADAVRDVGQAFATIPSAHVVEPAFCQTFLYELQQTDIDAVVAAYLGEGDPMLRHARSAVAGLSGRQFGLLTTLIDVATRSEVVAYRTTELLGKPQVAKLFRSCTAVIDGVSISLPAGWSIPDEMLVTGDADLEGLAADLDSLDGFVDVDEDGFVRVEREGMDSLFALAYEGRARHGHKGGDLVEFLTLLLQPPARDMARAGEGLDRLIDAIRKTDAVHETNCRALARLLQVNDVDVAAIADQLGMDFHREDSNNWVEVAEAILLDARGEWWGFEGYDEDEVHDG